MQRESNNSLILETPEEIEGVKTVVYYSPGLGLEGVDQLASKLFLRIAVEIHNNPPIPLTIEESELVRKAVEAAISNPNCLSDIYEKARQRRLESIRQDNKMNRKFPSKNHPVLDLAVVEGNLLKLDGEKLANDTKNIQVVSEELERLALK